MKSSARIVAAILFFAEVSCISGTFETGYHFKPFGKGCRSDSLPRCFAANEILSLRVGQQDNVPSQYSKTSVVSRFKSMGKAYGELLKTHPIATKSITSCFMFGLSDWLAQCLKPEKLNLSRIQMACLVGLFYFGPAAHVWYNFMFQLFPEKSVGFTVIKSALGQLVFGPCFMCVFFAASLVQQQGSFSWIAYWNKICHDLPPAWITGLGFWPVMSYISYTTVPKDWIPLFSNCCALLFNIYLSFISYRKGVAR